MSRRLMLAACALLLAAPAPSAAQNVGQRVLDDLANAGRDFGAIWMTPLNASGRDWMIVGGVLGAAALVSPLDDEVDRWALRNRDRGFLDAIRPLRRGGQFYSINELTPYVAATYVVGVAIDHQGIRDGIMGCAAAYGANTVIRHQVIYRLIGRNRPDTVRNRPEGYVPVPASHGDQYRFSVPSKGWGTHSFPGGHLATMTVCASFLSHRFDMGLVEPVLGGLVAAMGIGRIADRGHWLSDQVVGAAFGYAIGREVARRQLKRLADDRASQGLPPTTQLSLEQGSGPLFNMGLDATRIGWVIVF
jgi:membrane-associated phospholipid phosphatase